MEPDIVVLVDVLHRIEKAVKMAQGEKLVLHRPLHPLLLPFGLRIVERRIAVGEAVGSNEGTVGARHAQALAPHAQLAGRDSQPSTKLLVGESRLWMPVVHEGNDLIPSASSPPRRRSVFPILIFHLGEGFQQFADDLLLADYFPLERRDLLALRSFLLLELLVEENGKATDHFLAPLLHHQGGRRRSSQMEEMGSFSWRRRVIACTFTAVSYLILGMFVLSLGLTCPLI